MKHLLLLLAVVAGVAHGGTVAQEEQCWSLIKPKLHPSAKLVSMAWTRDNVSFRFDRQVGYQVYGYSDHAVEPTTVATCSFREGLKTTFMSNADNERRIQTFHEERDASLDASKRAAERFK